MAAMTTALTEFSTIGNSRTYALTGHTVLEPKLVVQKRSVPQGAQTMADATFNVVFATEDADGAVLSQKINLGATGRIPVNGIEADVDAALVIFRDIVASDEFTTWIKSQLYFS